MEVMNSVLKLEKYAEYKDSRTEWLGMLPIHWEIVRMKRLFFDYSEKNRQNEELLSVTQNQGVVPRTWVANRMVMPSGNLESFKFINEGDFAISLRSFEGGLEYCYHNGIISPAYTVLKIGRSGLRPDYYKYLFKCKSFISEIQTSVVGIREGKNISYPELSYSFLPIPSKEEQTRIAQFLDQKTVLIDKAIAQKERLIELLRERRQILIHRVVTRGLDAEVEMKDSGVDWIGEIPKHWEVKKLRHLGRCQNGISKGGDYFGSGFPFVSYGDVYKNLVLPEKVKGLAESNEVERELFSVKKGDIFFTRTSETIEEIGLASTCLKTIRNATFAGFVIRFRPESKKMDENFSKYYFRSELQRIFFIKEMNLVIRASLSQELLKKMIVLQPPLNEQKEIGNFLDSQCSLIERTILTKQKEIEKLKEYKTTLINAAVTGKIKIPEEHVKNNHPQ